MKIGITGSQNRIDELKQKVSSTADLVEIKDTDLWQLPNMGLDAIIDLRFDDNTEHLHHYLHLQFPVLVSAAKIQLAAEFTTQDVTAPIFGINALPTFINRPLLEASYYHEEHKPVLEALAAKLGWQCAWVNDRVGMVTPRIIFMIINEAYYTVQEGTAGKQDIDTGMKLGTNYPFGPFEWAEKIGIKNVYEVLDAIYTDTRDERYKICPLLKTEYFKSL
jgi:3-hydroxybutyryl-CoA dehydrogenase